MQTQPEKDAINTILDTSGVVIKYIEIVLCAVFLIVAYREQYLPRFYIANFESAEVFVLFITMFMIVLSKELHAEIIAALACVVSIAGHFYQKFFMSLICSILYYAAFLSNVVPYYYKFQYSVSGAFYLYLSMAFSNEEWLEDLAFVVGSLQQLVCSDFGAAAVQLAYYEIQNRAVYRSNLLISYILVGFGLSQQVRGTLALYEGKKDRIRRLESHAVMNAYVTMR